MDTVSAETGVKLLSKWKICAVPYVGGRGADGRTPALFPVDQPQQQNSANSAQLSPEALLGALQKERQRSALDNNAAPTGPLSVPGKVGDSEVGNVFRMAGTKNAPVKASPSAAAAPPKVLDVQDVLNAVSQKPKQGNCVTTEQPTTSAQKTQQSVPVANRVPLIKKGFLSDGKASLYPEGSGEGTGSDKGGSYARLMSRSVVVDASSGAVKPPELAAPSLPAPSSQPKELKTAPKVLPDKRELQEMDALLRHVDRDWARAAEPVNSRDLEIEQVSSMFSDMAKAWGETPTSLSSPGSSSTNAQKLPVSTGAQVPDKNARITVHSSFPVANAVIAEEIVSQDGQHILRISLHGLNGMMSSIADPSVNLQVSSSEVCFTVGKNRLVVHAPLPLQASTTAASFKKKAGTLHVDVKMV